MRKHPAAALVLVVAALSTGTQALAQAQYHRHDLPWASSGVGTAVDTLQRTQYGRAGVHRANALGLLRSAHAELRAANEYAVAHGYQWYDLGAVPAPRYPGMSYQQVGDRPVYNAQQHCQTWIAVLQRDNRDYGGHRVNAIGYLQRAEAELTAALQGGE